MDGTEQPRQVLVKCVLVGDNAVRCVCIFCICIIVGDNAVKCVFVLVGEMGDLVKLCLWFWFQMIFFYQVGKTRLICARACNQKVEQLHSILFIIGNHSLYSNANTQVNLLKNQGINYHWSARCPIYTIYSYIEICQVSLSQLLTTHVPTVWAIDQYRIYKEVKSN